MSRTASRRSTSQDSVSYAELAPPSGLHGAPLALTGHQLQRSVPWEQGLLPAPSGSRA